MKTRLLSLFTVALLSWLPTQAATVTIPDLPTLASTNDADLLYVIDASLVPNPTANTKLTLLSAADYVKSALGLLDEADATALYQATNAILTEVAAGQGGSLTNANGATNANQFVTLAQLESASAGGLVSYFNTAEHANEPGIVAGSTNWNSTVVPNLWTNAAITRADGTYLAAFLSTNTFSSVASGLAVVNVWMYDDQPGTGAVAAELYVYNPESDLEEYEFTPASAYQTVPTALSLLTFSVPVTDYTSTTNFHILVKLKVQESSTPDPTLRVVTGGAYASHVSFSVPQSTYVKKTGDTMTGTLVAPDITVTNNLTVGGQILAADGSAAAPSIGWTSDNDGSGTGFYRVAPNTFGLSIDGVVSEYFTQSGVSIRDAGAFKWSQNSAASGTADTYLYRDAAGTLAQRNGTTAQTNRVYGTYTDASNYARTAIWHDGTSTTTLAGETAGTGADDQSIKLKVAGNGALYVDGDTAGNARGNNAVDLQTLRSGASQVGSGANSVTIGARNTTSGSSSVAIGQDVTASGGRSVAIGVSANAYLYGQHSQANGYFSAAGDSQSSTLRARITTAGSSSILFLDGTDDYAVIPANTTWAFTITVAARSTDGGTGDEESAAYKFEGCIERDGSNNTALVGTVSKVVLAEDDSGWDCNVAADDTNESLNVTGTSDDANTVRWTALYTLVEVGG